MNYIDALKWRYAVKSFSSQTLPQTAINGLAEGVRLSASAYGLQPYKLLIVQSKSLKQACLPFSFGQNKVAACSHLLLLANFTQITEQMIDNFIYELAMTQGISVQQLRAYKNTICGDILNRSPQQQRHWAEQQCYIALGKLLSYAAINQIDACPMSGFENTGINRVLGLNEQDLNAAILCPVGIRSQDDNTANRTKYRKTTEQLVVTL